MWDERYDSEQYAYGKEPNDFLAQQYQQLPKGNVISLAEGEGRNAVFLAKMGYSVTAVDGSKVGLEKAAKLAIEHNVNIVLIHADLAEFDFGEAKWDAVVSIYCPLPSAVRSAVYKRAVKGLKPGGVFLLEAYTPEQINYNTGGGPSADTKTSKNDLEDDLTGLSFVHLEELKREVFEGSYHTGLASVLQAIAKK
ncbi:class I SAM-dependent methyltransferase [Pseudoalteromonas carrageenovora]|uniref:class I SAM-dependent methyltransferase n=1 Tax=Pseudoalteromonas carrageenovora TaxID=227 RepID=UPI0026E45DDA|nr:class I SAM-dependent methyltransferase [Pseudoalteromonas carrageenovora]MDO6834899.1 class I SAM-dependent methyltransferase [Pseudoalteromonas carrageenovora]